MTEAHQTLLLASLAAWGVLVTAFIAFRWQRHRREQRQRAAAAGQAQIEFAAAAEQAVGDIRGSVSGLAGVLHGTEKRLAELERQFHRLESSATRVGHGQGVQQAIDLARSGVACDEIVRRCGVSRAEAQLLAEVHAHRATH